MARARACALAEQVQRSAAERVRAGKVSPLEETKAGVATATTRLQLTAAQNELQAAHVALAALWGTAAPRFERVEGEIETVTAIPYGGCRPRATHQSRA
jgi:outer membrane protein, heavy metal efflux system